MKNRLLRTVCVTLAMTILLSTVTVGNVFAKDFPDATTDIKAGNSNGLEKENGVWVFYNDNEIDYEFVGMAKNEYNWWYVENGKINFKYTGVSDNKYGTWYMKNGKLDLTFTGMAKGDEDWVYLKNGKFDDTYTGMAKNEYGWWHINKGKLDREYTGLSKNQYGTWFIKNGKIDYSYTGMIKHGGKWYYISNAKIDKSFEGMAKNEYNWWYIKDGCIDYSFKGLAKNDYGWWYINNGCIDRKYKGIARNKYGLWYVSNGTIDYKYKGTCKCEMGTYNISNGKAKRKRTQSASSWKYSYALDIPCVADTTSSWNLILVNRDYILPDGYINNIKLSYATSNTSERLDSRVAPYYQRMYNDALSQGVYLTPCSGYRSISLQRNNFENNISYLMNCGYSRKEATLKTSREILPPQTSEHNAGLAMDITSVSQSFENSAAFRWLVKNAHKYGFILRYPKDKQSITNIIYEPWHWRFVGVEAATEMKESGQCLEEYLGAVNR